MNRIKANAQIDRTLKARPLESRKDVNRKSLSQERSVITGREDAETAATNRQGSVMTTLVKETPSASQRNNSQSL